MNKHIKTLVSLLLIAVLFIGASGGASAAKTYKDIPKTHKSADEIYYLTDRGIFKGYADKTFRPKNTMTRGDVSRIIWNGSKNIGMKYPKSQKRATIAFKDVKKDNKYYNVVNNMYKFKIDNGYSNKTFRPNTIVTHAQLVKMVSVAYMIPKSNKKHPFSDIKKGSWYEQHVKNLYAVGVIEKPGKNKKFNPSQKMTRAQVAEYVARAMEYAEFNMPIDDSLEKKK